METPYHIPLFPIPCHFIPYHWNGGGIPIPEQAILSFQSCHWVSGVLFTRYENYFCRLQYLSIGLHLLWTGSSDFCCHFKLQVEAILQLWSFENWLNWALSQVLAIYTVDNQSITSHLKLYILPGHLINTVFITDKSILHPPQWYGLWEAKKTRHLCIGSQLWTRQDFIHCRGGNFSQITAQGKHAYFKYNMFEICHKKILHSKSPHVCKSGDVFSSW